LTRDVDVVEGVPSRLNAALTDGELDVAAISAAHYLAHRDELALVGDLCIAADGPVGADLLLSQRRHDLYLAMFHDQGHIAIKVHDFARSVSVALGLPFLRTSVDHGTAFDIAGRGVADPISMIEAIRVAAELASGRPLGAGRAA